MRLLAKSGSSDVDVGTTSLQSIVKNVSSIEEEWLNEINNINHDNSSGPHKLWTVANGIKRMIKVLVYE